MNKITFDIESTGLDYLADDFKIHIISTYNHVTKESISFFEDNIQEGVEYLQAATELTGHNIIGYDIPAINKVFGVELKGYVWDDYLIWELLNPERRGVGQKNVAVFNLEQAGKMLNISKDTGFEYKDFSVLTKAMIKQCERDVQISVALHNYLQVLISNDYDTLKQVIDLEMEVAKIIQRQTEYGVFFDKDSARDLGNSLGADKEAIVEELRSIFPPVLKGSALVEFNPGSTRQVAQRLIEKYNWKPIKTTPTGIAQVNEEVLKSLKYPEAKKILQYNDLEKTISFIDSWLKFVKEDNRIHASLNTLGAVTRRMTHYKPNLSQVPSTRKTNGKGCRSLFCAPPGRVLVGMDFKGLEACVIAHYAQPYDNGYMIKIVEAGSIHDITATSLYGVGFSKLQRDIGKRVFFGKVFGARPKRIAKEVGVTIEEGQRIFKMLNRAYPKLLDLEKAVKETAIENGRLKVIDGFKVIVEFKDDQYTGEKYPDAPVNRLVQTTGAILCKRMLVIADRRLKQTIPTARFVINSHDEVVVECDIIDAEPVAHLLKEAVKETQLYYNFRCKLEGETKVGHSWAEVH